MTRLTALSDPDNIMVVWDDDLADEAHPVRAARLGVAERKFNKAEPRDPDGKWSRVGALLGRLKRAGGDAARFDDGDYVDWSTPAPNGRGFEFVERGDAVRLTLTTDEIDSVHEGLSDSLHRNSDGGLVLDDGREVSWQPLDDDGERWELNALDADGNQVTFDWPRSRMEHFHHALTGTLLAEAMGGTQ